MVRFHQNPRLSALQCLRCDRQFSLDDPIADQGIGCPACREEGFPASLRLIYDSLNPPERRKANGMQRYAGFLPYLDFPDLGQGEAPLIDEPGLANRFGVDHIWLKNESHNPTGSHKDRMSPLVIARAASLGRGKVVAASSGNAGISLAAFAASAGMRCTIIATSQIDPVWAQAIKLTGADLRMTPTTAERWELMETMVSEGSWYPVTNYLRPPVGSNPFGLQGYKTIAFELIDEVQGQTPTIILVPTARGDLLWGIWEGFQEAARLGWLDILPRMVAVEPSPRLSRVLAGEDYRLEFHGSRHGMVSIGGTTVTFQSVKALNDSSGVALEVNDQQAHAAQISLGKRGIFAESSAAASLAGLEVLQQSNQLDPSDRVVLMITSHGYK